MAKSIEDRARFDFVRYANCWEDADILVDALRPSPGMRFLSIASAGDNTLSLLASGAEVVAVDLNPAQLACVEIRCAGFRHLNHEELLAFLGWKPCDRRLEIYAGIRQDLSADARAFWDQKPQTVRDGVVHQGKFENYFRLFRLRIVPFIHRNKTVLRLLEKKSREEREEFYVKTWDTWRWRLLFRLFFSRFVMGRLGRDKEFFRFVEGSVSDRILARARHAMTVLCTHDNPYLHLVMTGNFGSVPPRYLRPEWHGAIRDNLANLHLFRGTVQDAVEAFRGRGFDGFNLSDIFEYLDSDVSESIYERLLGRANAGARFAYWNMLRPFSRPNRLTCRVRTLSEESKRLFLQDKAFFYSAFFVDEVIG